jgi:hypothetical protein
MIIFDSAAGQVSQVMPEGDATPAMITFPGFDYASLQLVTTGIGLSLKPVYQAMDTLGGDVHLVSFGETLTPLPLSGLIFERSCEIGRGGGLVSLVAWWQEQNLLRRREPVLLTIGSDFPIKAFVTDMVISVADVESGTWRFELMLLRIPARVQVLTEMPVVGIQLTPPGTPAAPSPAIIPIVPQIKTDFPDYTLFTAQRDGGIAAPSTAPTTVAGYSSSGTLRGPLSNV